MGQAKTLNLLQRMSLKLKLQLLLKNQDLLLRPPHQVSRLPEKMNLRRRPAVKVRLKCVMCRTHHIFNLVFLGKEPLQGRMQTFLWNRGFYFIINTYPLSTQDGYSQKSPVYFCRREFDCDYQRTDTAQELSESHQASGERAERSWKEVPEKRRGFASEILWLLQGHQEEVLAEENRVRGFISFQTAVMTLFWVSWNEKTKACLRVFSFSTSFQSSWNHLSNCLF